tara:strand:+ start:11455 stop:12009 length:555 start_codon:yes stop_codon:yes gene_type:complete
MASVLDIINGISQAAANAYDGSHDERYTADGEARKVGLKREEGDPILDSREMDGFNIKYYGNKICVEYHGEMKLKEVHDANKFENDINSRLNDISKYLKKEYKKVTGNALSLTKEGESDILVQHMSNIRSWVTAKQFYKVGGMDGVLEVNSDSTSEDRLNKAVKDWLELGHGPKPKNVTRKKEK